MTMTLNGTLRTDGLIFTDYICICRESVVYAPLLCNILLSLPWGFYLQPLNKMTKVLKKEEKEVIQ